MHIDRTKAFTFVFACLVALASATDSHAANFTIGGTLTGLNSGTSITLLDNGGDSLKVTANGKFTFATALPTGATYLVTVGTEPTGETCTVTAGSGTVATHNVTNVKVACKYTIGGTLSGLNTGASITLLDNGGDALTMTANGKFTFKTALVTGTAYKVTVGTQPSGETCAVTAGTGTVGTKNVTNVKVACKFTIGGTLSGLSTAASVTLLDNGADALTLTANGKFTFATALVDGAAYKVTVGTQPAGETCTVTAGSGTVGTKNITTVKVACASSQTFTIGGTLSGLSSGKSVTLLDNGGDSLKLTANGTFVFATALASGATYNVTVGTEPTGETCTVTNGSGTVGSANVTNVKVACASSQTFTIGGTLSGLSSGKSVTLLDNGGDSLKLTANGTFVFATPLASGATYNVTVGTQPTGETCTVTNGSGTVGSANVTNVAVACSASTGGSAYWIPYSATPVPGATPPGSTGLFLIPSDKLSSSPAPTFVTTDTNQLIGIGTQISESGGVLTYSPQVMMYGDTDSTGKTRIFGLKLAGTTSVPTPTQVSNLVVPSTKQICPGVASALTDLSTPTTLFAVIQVGTATQCAGGSGTFEVVHYTDSATTAPVVVSINTTDINTLYQNGKLVGLLLYASTTNSLDLFADDTFTSPTEKITGITGVNDVSGVLDAATLSTSAYFLQTSTTTANQLYRFDGSTLVATEIQSLGTGGINTPAVQDDTNLYYIVTTPGTGTTVNDTFSQVALTGGTPKLLYTAPSFTSQIGTLVQAYQLIGSNDSVIAFQFYSNPYTSGIADPSKSTATLYSMPVGKTTTTPTTLANYTTGNQLPETFVSAPTGSGYPGSILFATVQHATGTFPLYTYAFSAVSIPLTTGTPAAPIAKSAYLPLAIISSALTDNVWQVTGITDTDGGYGGGTANAVNVSNLTDTPYTTTGGGNYVFPTGFNAQLFAISSNNIALGVLYNTPAVLEGGAAIQEDGAAVDLTINFLLPISLTNTLVLPY